uniref:Arrestin domain-containing protein 2-like isoform X1 n=1 Tax=Hirondellea gigas TaxID=1518452 RepID=A0A6A7G010_9CRUS
MTVKSIKVELHPEYPVYFGWQIISGIVRAEVLQEISCKDVKVTCSGKAKVRWTEGSGKQQLVFKAKEKYVNLSKIVWTPEIPERGKLPAGNYAWPFSFQLPQDIPSSFEGTFGFIRYKVKANINISSAYDKKHSIYFSVCCPVDLNYDDNAKSPLKMVKTDTYGCCCCVKGPVALNFNCQYSGAVSGEKFKIRGEVANQGRKEVTNSTVTIYQKVTYRSGKSKNKKTTDQVCKVTRGAIAPGDRDFYVDVPLEIPAVVPSLKFCNIMELQYIIEIKATFGSYSYVYERVPFNIGTIPFVTEGENVPIPAARGDAFVGFPPPITFAPPLTGFVPEGGLPAAGPEMRPPMMGPPAGPMMEPFYNHPVPGTEDCYFCGNIRMRLNMKSPAPKYISYASVM